jgi:hypothetical protein
MLGAHYVPGDYKGRRVAGLVAVQVTKTDIVVVSVMGGS